MYINILFNINRRIQDISYIAIECPEGHVSLVYNQKIQGSLLISNMILKLNSILWH
jgi:hypothetical protein